MHTMPALARRPFLQLSLSGALGLCAAPAVLARERVVARAESPLVGVDPLFIATGLTSRWQSAMKQDLGWSARWSAMETTEVLAQLEQGQVDAGLFLSHPRADELDKQGLIYNRVALARTDVLLLGPTDDLAGIRSENDPARALAQVLAAYNAGAARWQPPPAGSALASLADQLTKGLASKGSTPNSGNAAKAVQNAPAYRLMTRAQWLTAPPKGERLKVWLADAPAISLQAQIASSFRARHAGAKLLTSWLQWPLAQNAIKSTHPAWQAMKE
jgi:tungstate transport system substrate-binding protein